MGMSYRVSRHRDRGVAAVRKEEDDSAEKKGVETEYTLSLHSTADEKKASCAWSNL